MNVINENCTYVDTLVEENNNVIESIYRMCQINNAC